MKYITKGEWFGVSIFILAIIYIVINGLFYVNNKHDYNDKIEQLDSIIIVNDSITNNNICLDTRLDSLQGVVDSLNEELFIAKYKLGRIKNYNDIAAKGNNIKYLRGWINRVLNE